MIDIELLQENGYFKRFYELTAKYKSHREAYEALENELFQKFRIGKYSSYNSFKRNKNRYMNKVNR